MSRKQGRPLMGDKKRVRLTITLHPDDVAWLKRISADRNENVSALIDCAIHSIQKTASSRRKASIPIPYARIAELCATHHVLQLSLFGSILTRAFSNRSDIDILVEFEKGFTPGLLGLSSLQSELSRLFGGRQVDLRTPKDLGRHLRVSALANMEVIYAA